MGSIWLRDLPDVLRGAGLGVETWPGWEARGRSSGGYVAVRAVFCHHTASNTSPVSDMSYMWEGSPDEPVGAIYLARDGMLTVGAAGATNTQGKGGPWNLSTGTIPKDCGNEYGIALEAANAGTGEPWPAAQIDAYVRAVRALIDAYGLAVGDIMSHREWCEPSCPGRKIDPAGPSPYATGSASWDMDGFRADVANVLEPPPQPVPPTIGEHDMIALDLGTPGVDPWWTRMTYTGSEICHVRSPADQVQARGGVPVVSVSEPELGALLDTLTAIGPSPFGDGGQAPNAALDIKWTQARGRT